MDIIEWLKDIDPTILLERTLTIVMKVLSSIAILVIGFWLSSKLSRLFYIFTLKRKVEASVRNYLREVVKIVLNIIVVASAIAALGINLNGMLAVLGGTALLLGVGLQGGISNIAGGIMIIFSKPYKVGDLIQMQNQMGYVERIDIFSTAIRTVNNELVVLPNSPVFSQTLTNYSTKGTIRIDVRVGIEYNSDYKKLAQLIRGSIREDDMFSNNHPVIIGIENFNDSSISLAVRAHTKTVNYWEAPLRLNKIIKDTMDTNGFKIPFPQRDLHIINNSSATTQQHQLPLSAIEE